MKVEEKLDIVIKELKQRTIKQCYKMEVLDEEPKITDSKIGGQAYIKKDEDYPKDSKGEYMPLFVQINLEDINLENYPRKRITSTICR